MSAIISYLCGRRTLTDMHCICISCQSMITWCKNVLSNFNSKTTLISNDNLR